MAVWREVGSKMTFRFLGEVTEVQKPLAMERNIGSRTNWRGNMSFILEGKFPRLWNTHVDLSDRLMTDQSDAGPTYVCGKP